MFGKSVFQSVLERLRDEEQDETVVADVSVPGIRGLNAGFVANIRPSGLGESASVTRAYYETAGDEMLAPPRPVPPPVLPDHLRRTRAEEIAEDLDIAETDTPASLMDKRRRFAASNHPDRHAPQFRPQATLRMKIANMLIDEALRRLKPRQARGRA